MLRRWPHTLLHDPARRPMWRWLWAALFVVVGVAALTPGELAPTVTASDKVDHLLGFAALSATGLLAVSPGWRSALQASVCVLAYGVLIELLQTQVPGRHGELQDAVADALGVALGVTMVICLRRLFRSQEP